MLSYIAKYFTLNRSERNAIVALISFVLVLVLVKYLIVYQYRTNTQPVIVVDLDAAAEKLAAEEISTFGDGDFKKNFAASKGIKDSLFYFDPNFITETQAVQLGFDERCAQMLMNYRKGGGKFRKPSDLSKLYCMNGKLFGRLESYIIIASSGQEESPKKNYEFKKPQNVVSVEINSADTAEWDKLKGIGYGYAKRIIKYRTLLGGFTSIEQVKEVYNFPDSLYQSIKGNLTVNTSLVKKLKVNSAEFKELVHHPYIKYEGTKCIFALKRNKKLTEEDLVNSSCFSREQLQKLLPYLDFE